MFEMLTRVVIAAAVISTGFITELRASAHPSWPAMPAVPAPAPELISGVHSINEILGTIPPPANAVGPGVEALCNALLHVDNRDDGAFLTPVLLKNVMLPSASLTMLKDRSVDLMIVSEKVAFLSESSLLPQFAIRFTIDVFGEKKSTPANWAEQYVTEYLFDLFLNAWASRMKHTPSAKEELPIGQYKVEKVLTTKLLKTYTLHGEVEEIEVLANVPTGSFSSPDVKAKVVNRDGQRKVEITILTEDGREALEESLVLSMVEKILVRRANETKAFVKSTQPRPRMHMLKAYAQAHPEELQDYLNADPEKALLFDTLLKNPK